MCYKDLTSFYRGHQITHFGGMQINGDFEGFPLYIVWVGNIMTPVLFLFHRGLFPDQVVEANGKDLTSFFGSIPCFINVFAVHHPYDHKSRFVEATLHSRKYI